MNEPLGVEVSKSFQEEKVEQKVGLRPERTTKCRRPAEQIVEQSVYFDLNVLSAREF